MIRIPPTNRIDVLQKNWEKFIKSVDSFRVLCYSEECYIMARYACLSERQAADAVINKKTGVKRQWKKTEFVL